MNRRNFSSALGLAMLGPKLALAAEAQKVVSIVVTTSASTSSDIVARLLSPYLDQRLRRTYVVDNRVGASGIIGMQYVAHAPADGSIVMVSPSTFMTITALNKHLPFDVLTDFTPVTPLAASTMAAIASVRSSLTSLQDVVDRARSKPGALNYGSPGVGTPQHLLMELFSSESRLKLTHIPFKGTAPMVTELAAGRIDVVFMPVHTCVELANAGKVKVIGILAQGRSALFPDVPTFQEQGFPMDSFEWSCGFFLPPGAPGEMAREYYTHLREILKEPRVIQTLQANGLTPVMQTPEEFKLSLAKAVERWNKVATDAGLQAQ